MAVNLLRINYLRNPLTLAVWNVYSQILRHNCENKDNLEINFINKLHERKSLKNVKLNEFKISSAACDAAFFDDDELLYDENERRLIESLQNLNGNLSYVKWISVRNECIDLICSTSTSIGFFVKFIGYLVKIDPKYYDENHEFLKYLHQLTMWRESDSKNNDSIIENLCELYINHHESDELLNKIKIIIQALLQEILSKHGSSAVVVIKTNFKRISEQTGNYEALYLLWRNLFESFWFSDQQIADELIAQHLEVRKMLSSRSKHLCFGYFQNNNTDLVNKLVQIFLKYKMRTSVVEILKLYLAFEIWRKNSSAATEIVHLFLELNIPLSDSENRKYLDLLLKRHQQSPTTTKTKDVEKRGKMSEKINVENYKFKF